MSAPTLTLGAGLAAGIAAGWLFFGESPSPEMLIDADQTRAVSVAQAPVIPPATPAVTAPVEAPPPAGAPTTAVQTPGAARPAVDETALRYFARQGDSRRLEAEIARLRALYPDWTPPDDPLAVEPHSDARLDAMWKLYSEGRYPDIRKAIADAQAADPAFQPPADLLDRLAMGEARTRLVNASEVKQYDTVVRIAADTPGLLTCGDVDVLWRLAEAFASTDRQDRARDAYLYVLENCTDPGERVATVEKALPLLSRDRLDQLLAQEKTAADGKGEFAAIRLDLARQAVVAGGREPPSPVTDADRLAVEAAAERDGLASDATLLGWLYLRADDPARAETWFRRARDKDDTAEASEGLALALIQLRRPADAESAMANWHDASDDARKVYLAAGAALLSLEPPPDLAPEVLARIVAAASAARDAPTAQLIGWYAHALRQERTAVQWFETALAWNPEEEPAAYGLALVSQILGDRARVADLQARWAGRSPRIAALTERRASAVAPRTAAPPPPIARAASPRERTASPSASGSARRGDCSRTSSLSGLTGAAALARGWCLLDLDRPTEAVKAFEQAMTTGDERVGRDAAWGQSLAYLRAGLTDEASVAASKKPQDAKRSVELEASILSTRASNFFDQKRYSETLLALDQRARLAPERLDLMVLRGYAYMELGRLGEARRVFEALTAAGSREGPRGLGVISQVDRTGG